MLNQIIIVNFSFQDFIDFYICMKDISIELKELLVDTPRSKDLSMQPDKAIEKFYVTLMKKHWQEKKK